MTERSRVQKLNLHYGDHLSGTIHLDHSLEQKLWKTLTWHCCMCCNPANGRVDFEECLAYKIQLHGYRMNCQISETKIPKKLYIYSQTCLQRPPLGPEKYGYLKEMQDKIEI